ncbi:MAG: ABC transporter ATP-binding protein [Anaerolineales bacterium]|nr:ABC transporter ATP-binding protein [Anaerolineales bacterium]
MIHLDNITKSYEMGTQIVHALRGVSLDIEAGEFVAIMGPSGSGKSTMMNILGCLDTPTDGTYLLDNINVSHMDDNEQARVRNQRIGFVFQRFNLLARTQALKQVALPLMYSGVRAGERAERARKALESVGLGDRTDHKPDELSGGQQQRVAIARALVHDPTVVLADEPTASLDTERAYQVVETFATLIHEQQRAGIMVTHDLRMCSYVDRVIQMVDGRLARVIKDADEIQAFANGVKVPESARHAPKQASSANEKNASADKESNGFTAVPLPA